MDTLPIIEHNLFSTSVLSPFDESTLYTVATRRHSEGYWVDVIYRVEWDADGDSNPSKSDEKHSAQTELGTVSYIDAGTTHVRFGGQPEGTELGLDMFLRRRNPYSNSRIFAGADGSTYKWRINGKNLELFDTTTDTLIARSHPRRSKFSFPSSFPGSTNLRKRSIPTIPAPHTVPFTAPTTASTIHSAQTARTLSPSLSLHPALLSLDSTLYDPQLLDGIVLTFFIMQRLLRERLRFQYP